MAEAGEAAFEALCARICEDRGWERLPEGVKIRWDNGRQQAVLIERFDHEGQGLIRLYTIIGSAERLNAERLAAALQINANLAHGALAIRDGNLVLTNTLIVEEADLAEVEASLDYLGTTADYYERALFRGDAN